jgi:sulfur carrier protein ThiS
MTGSQAQHNYTVVVKFLAGHQKNDSNNKEILVNGDETISDIINRLRIDRELVCAAIFEGTFITFETLIQKSGTLKLLPAVGGG